MKIAVASGKGGTGKTTISIHLYYFLTRIFHKAVHLVDCDVEEPNDLLFFPDAQKKREEKVFLPVPVINNSTCTFCRKCVDWCEFNAISMIGKLKFAEIDRDLCHSCGACVAACSFNAITEVNNSIGTVTNFTAGINSQITEGRLKIGSAMQTSVIKYLKKNVISTNSEIFLFDAPPGTSCPVVETIFDVDFVILVTEPTPFGLHDLKLMIDLVNELRKPFGIIINKSGTHFENLYRYIIHNNLELLGEIPFSKKLAKRYAVGDFFADIPQEIANIYNGMLYNILHKFQL